MAHKDLGPALAASRVARDSSDDALMTRALTLCLTRKRTGVKWFDAGTAHDW